MADTKSRISLLGFKNLDISEVQRSEDIVLKKLAQLEREIRYDILRLQLKQHTHEHKHGSYFIHEIIGDLYFGSARLHASYSGKNLYQVLSRVMDKLLAEVLKKQKKTEPQHPIQKKAFR